MNNLLIEFCDFKNRPSGGQLTFARNFIAAYGDEFHYLGYGLEGDTIGSWVVAADRGGRLPNFFFVSKCAIEEGKRIFPARLTACLKFIRHILKLRRRRFGVIFVQSPEALFCASLLKADRIVYRFAGIANPLVFSRYLWARNFAVVFDAIFFSFLKRCDLFFVTAQNSDVQKMRIKLERGGCGGNVSWLPTFVNDKVFNFNRELPKDRPRFVMVGRLNIDKGIELVLNAFRIFQEQKPCASLTIVGDGEERNVLEERIKALDLCDSVFLVGRKSASEVADILIKSNIFVLGSRQEGWPTALVEAVAVGLYAVATRVSGVDVIIDSTERGIVVEYGDLDSLLNAMLAAWEVVSKEEWLSVPDERYLASNMKSLLKL